MKAAKIAGNRHKTHPAFPNIIGISLCGIGRQREAIGYFKKALSLDPAFHDARKNLAQTLVVLDQPDTALKLLARLVADIPKDTTAWYLLGQTEMKLGHAQQALDAATKSIDLNPRQPHCLNLRALVWDSLGDTDAALRDFEAALRLNPDDVEVLANISLPLARQTRHQEAMQAARHAVELAPHHVAARLRLAGQLAAMGQREPAIHEYHQVLAVAPGNGDAIESLAALQDDEQNQALAPIARAALKKAPRKSPARAALGFALAQIARQSKDTAAEAQYLADANHEMAGFLSYNAEADSVLNASILAQFPRSLERSEPTNKDPGPTPIFVVGLPRSGTTLTESILGAHPDVKALGERNVVGSLLSGVIQRGQLFGPDDVAKFLEQYQERLPDLPEGTIAYVDKMPENYRLVGFIKSAFPNCRVVNLRRDPRDVALSMWRGRFTGTALSYTYDLAGMAHRFNLYAQTMAHWNALFPGEILEIRYEDLVADVATASQTLATFCDLDWVASMARPDLNQDQILTLSASQLRQPVHDRSVGKWRQQQELLTPFINRLDPALWPDLD